MSGITIPQAACSKQTQFRHPSATIPIKILSSENQDVLKRHLLTREPIMQSPRWSAYNVTVFKELFNRALSVSRKSNIMDPPDSADVRPLKYLLKRNGSGQI